MPNKETRDAWCQSAQINVTQGAITQRSVELRSIQRNVPPELHIQLIHVV